MAADLVIHVWDPEVFGEDVLKVFFHNVIGHKYGCDFCEGWTIAEEDIEEQKIIKKYGRKSYTIIAETPEFYVGETSTLKATLFNDNSFLYGLDAYFDLMEGDPLLIDKVFLKKVKELDKGLYKFLKKYKGKYAFKVLW